MGGAIEHRLFDRGHPFLSQLAGVALHVQGGYAASSEQHGGLAVGHMRIDAATILTATGRSLLHQPLTDLRNCYAHLPIGMAHSLIHGDASDTTITATSDGTTTLLDFERCTVGTPEWNLASIPQVVTEVCGCAHAGRSSGRLWPPGSWFVLDRGRHITFINWRRGHCAVRPSSYLPAAAAPGIAISDPSCQ